MGFCVRAHNIYIPFITHVACIFAVAVHARVSSNAYDQACLLGGWSLEFAWRTETFAELKISGNRKRKFGNVDIPRVFPLTSRITSRLESKRNFTQVHRQTILEPFYGKMKFSSNFILPHCLFELTGVMLLYLFSGAQKEQNRNFLFFFLDSTFSC